MRVQIRNYIGIGEANLEIQPGINLIAGDNAVGKSSVLRGIAALVAGEVKPKDIGSGDFSAVVMEGYKHAELLLENGSTSASINYPDPKFVAQGEPPHASRFAVGSLAYTDLPERERAQFLSGLLKATPTPATLRKALQGQLDEGEIETIQKLLETHTWDEATEMLKERRVKLKGRWEDMTGERFGHEKAKDWVPKGWQPGHDDLPPNILQQRVTLAQQALDNVTRASIISEAEHNELSGLLGKRDPTNMALRLAKVQLPTIEADWAKLKRELDALPPIVEEGIACPHCGAHVVVRPSTSLPARGSFSQQPYTLLPLEPLTEGEPERRKRALAEKREEVAEANRKLTQQQGLIGACEEKLREIDRAEERLRGATKGNGEHPEDKLRGVKEALERVQASAARAKLAQDAAGVAERVKYHSMVIEILGPDGLRRDEMEKRLAGLEGDLLNLTRNLVTWKPISIDRDNLMPRWGGRPYALCSKSEQWRLNATLQVMIALIEGAALLCIDGADILTRNGQEDLFMGLLNKMPMPVVVGASYNRLKDVPDLPKAGIGHVYWIMDGVAKETESVP